MPHSGEQAHFFFFYPFGNSVRVKALPPPLPTEWKEEGEGKKFIHPVCAQTFFPFPFLRPSPFSFRLGKRDGKVGWWDKKEEEEIFRDAGSRKDESEGG